MIFPPKSDYIKKESFLRPENQSILDYQMDFSSWSTSEAFATNTETYIGISSPFIGHAIKLYFENQGLIQTNNSYYKEIYKFMWPVAKFKFHLDDKKGIKINPEFKNYVRK